MKIKELFPDINIITTVHSITFFEEVTSTKIIVLDGNQYSYKLIDSRDLGGLDYINREVFNSYSKKTNKNRFEELYMKVFNEVELSSDEIHFIKNQDNLSPEEKNIKSILLEELT